jgi:hypothetical protein
MAPDAGVADVIDIALRVARAIESVGGSYFVGGSLASSLQGEPRATNDIDIVLELPLGRISDLVRSLEPDFEVDRDMLKDVLLHGGSCNLFHLPTVVKVDLCAVGPTPYDEIEFARRRAVAGSPLETFEFSFDHLFICLVGRPSRLPLPPGRRATLGRGRSHSGGRGQRRRNPPRGLLRPGSGDGFEPDLLDARAELRSAHADQHTSRFC